MSQVYWLQLQLQPACSIIPELGCQSVSRKPSCQLHPETRGGESSRPGQSHSSPQTADREQTQGDLNTVTLSRPGPGLLFMSSIDFYCGSEDR